MDHAAGLIEMHIRPMFVCAQQLHVSAASIISDPILFLRVIERAQADRTFAPMFLLSALLRALRLPTTQLPDIRLPQGLKIVSGGESTNTAACATLVREYLVKLGAEENVIIPGFGLSETCAGVFFNFDFPRGDLAALRQFGAHGLPIPGIEFRIVDWDSSSGSEGKGTSISGNSGIGAAAPAPGELQLRGKCVFSHYWNDTVATSKAITADGWFRTGDAARYVDDNDNKKGKRRLLQVVGRDRDSLTVNEMRYSLEELLSRVQESGIPGLDPLWVTGFLVGDQESKKVECVMERGYMVLYRPTYEPENEPEQHVQTVLSIRKYCKDWSPLDPKSILAVPEERFVRKTTIGKLSRFKMRQLYLAGKMDDLERVQKAILDGTFLV